MGAIAKEVREEILKRVKQGEKVAVVSKDYGVSEVTIYSWLKGSTTKHVSATHTKDLVIAAFWDALMNTGQVPKIVHSDQGSEYTSADNIGVLERLGITISMSKKSSPWENAYQESYYNNFKTDLGLEFDRFEGTGELVEAIHHTIDYYNHSRIHTTLKMSPAQFKLLYANRVLDKFVNKTGT